MFSDGIKIVSAIPPRLTFLLPSYFSGTKVEKICRIRWMRLQFDFQFDKFAIVTTSTVSTEVNFLFGQIRNSFFYFLYHLSFVLFFNSRYVDNSAYIS